jgi:tetratricopeptide (TPR) repeat protein
VLGDDSFAALVLCSEISPQFLSRFSVSKRAILLKMLERLPKEAQSHRICRQRGHLLLADGRVEEAVPYLHRGFRVEESRGFRVDYEARMALQLTSSFEGPAGLLACWYQKNREGHFAKAREALQEALRLDSSLSEARGLYTRLQLLRPDLPDLEVGHEDSSQDLLEDQPLERKAQFVELYGETLDLFRLRALGVLAVQGVQVFLRAPLDWCRLLDQLPGVTACVPHGVSLGGDHFHRQLRDLKPFGRWESPSVIPTEWEMEYWRNRLGSTSTGPRVGVHWPFGSKPVGILPKGVHFVRLGGAHLGNSTATDLATSIPDMASLAALLGNLGFVLSGDPRTTHLAGALGIPCWHISGPCPECPWETTAQAQVCYPSLSMCCAFDDGFSDKLEQHIRSGSLS